jgi:phosphoglycolate phosphatase
MRLVLFDIDGTLLHAKGSGRSAFEQAVQAVCGGDGTCGFSFAGMTDGAIARLALRERGMPESEVAIQKLIARYLQILPRAMQAGSAETTELPGASECVSALLREPERVALGIGTGNVRASAELKLAAIGLAHAFRFGGYGCDAEERHQVLRKGEQRGRLLHPQAHATIVVGDTLRDVAAALAIGASCIGIALGDDSHDDLRRAGAVETFDDFRDESFLRLLLRA